MLLSTSTSTILDIAIQISTLDLSLVIWSDETIPHITPEADELGSFTATRSHLGRFRTASMRGWANQWLCGALAMNPCMTSDLRQGLRCNDLELEDITKPQPFTILLLRAWRALMHASSGRPHAHEPTTTNSVSPSLSMTKLPLSNEPEAWSI